MTETKTEPKNGEARGEILPANPMKNNLMVGERGIELSTLDDLWRFANIAYKSKLIPTSIASAEQAFIILQKGLELKLAPMAALTNMYVVNNRPVLYGEIGIALVRASGKLNHFRQFEVGEFPKDDFRAVCEVGRTGEQVIRKEFSIADAKHAGLWETNTWKRYPKDMLMWKATWRALKAGFADILQGVAGAEDMDEVIDVTPVSEGATKSERLADVIASVGEPLCTTEG